MTKDLKNVFHGKGQIKLVKNKESDKNISCLCNTKFKVGNLVFENKKKYSYSNDESKQYAVITM